jgi:hypothetical protein
MRLRWSAERVVIEIDGDHQQVGHGLAIRAAHVGAPPGGHLQALHVHVAVDVLGRREGAGNINVIIMTTQQQVRTEVEILVQAMAMDGVREAHAQAAPLLVPLGQRGDLCDPESRQGHEEGRIQIGPHGIAVEIGALQRVPGRVHLVVVKAGPRLFALAHHGAVQGFDRNPLRTEIRPPFRLAEWRDGSELLLE